MTITNRFEQKISKSKKILEKNAADRPRKATHIRKQSRMWVLNQRDLKAASKIQRTNLRQKEKISERIRKPKKNTRKRKKSNKTSSHHHTKRL